MSESDEGEILLSMVRDYGHLARKRTYGELTLAEYQRWADLEAQLKAKFPQGDRPPGGERRKSLRLPTRTLVEFCDPGGLHSGLIRQISTGGFFIESPFASEVGTQLRLVITIAEGGEQIEIAVEVVSVDRGRESARPGMGCKFGPLTYEQQKIVDEMFEVAIVTDT